jgi:hypothetical protein
VTQETLTEQECSQVPLLMPENRLPLAPDTALELVDPTATGGVAPFAFRFLTPVTGSGGVLPNDIDYDDETQTSTYDSLPPGIFMTKNPPMTYFTTEADEETPEQTDAKDDPGPSDD